MMNLQCGEMTVGIAQYGNTTVIFYEEALVFGLSANMTFFVDISNIGGFNQNTSLLFIY